MNKELKALHNLYDKHDPKVVGRARWCGRIDPVYACACGEYFYENDNGFGVMKMQKYRRDTVLMWIVNTVEALEGKELEDFRTYLRYKRCTDYGPGVYAQIFGAPPPAKRRRNKAAGRSISALARARRRPSKDIKP